MTRQASFEHFGDALNAEMRRCGPLCVGLDPYVDRIPPLFGAPGPDALAAFGLACVAALAGRVAAIKPQIALFEAWGPDGLTALAKITHAAREAGLLVVLDAKRGDIGATGQGYVDAYLGPHAWLHADAVTVNPYMGLDTLEPWVQRAQEAGKGVFVLVRTSNPGANAFQGLETLADASGRSLPMYLRVAEALAPIAEQLAGASGWSSLGVVVGATAPQEARAVRAILARAPFLVPGYGAQGAGPADALAGQAPGADGVSGGALINASRAALFAPACQAAPDLEAWTHAFQVNLAALQADLAGAST